MTTFDPEQVEGTSVSDEQQFIYPKKSDILQLIDTQKSERKLAEEKSKRDRLEKIEEYGHVYHNELNEINVRCHLHICQIMKDAAKSDFWDFIVCARDRKDHTLVLSTLRLLLKHQQQLFANDFFTGIYYLNRNNGWTLIPDISFVGDIYTCALRLVWSVSSLPQLPDGQQFRMWRYNKINPYSVLKLDGVDFPEKKSCCIQ